MLLRGYQDKLKNALYHAWQNAKKCVIAVLPTGGGKTATLSCIVKEMNLPTAVIAHRQELVTQLSVALARFGVYHSIIAPLEIVKLVNKLHIEELGKSYYRESAQVAVVGVDTLLARKDSLTQWCKTIAFWITDECHHLLLDNKWGKAVELFTNAKYGLGVTATPVRADGKGLGRHAASVFDGMVIGPNMRWLINEGFLTDYKIYAPPSDMRFDDVKVGASGDYNHKQLRLIAKESHIVGDVVKHYLRLANGKLGITFAPDIETAADIAEKFNAAGVNAKILHGKTPDQERISTMNQFKARQIMQIVNVDILGEGVDVPAVEVVSFARKTESFSLFVQQCGRALRPIYAKDYPLDTREQRLAAIAASFKPTAIIIDHVGNIVRHAVARDCEFTGKLVIDLCCREWSLDGRSKGGDKDDPDAIPLRTCTNPDIDCFGDYPRIYKSCPYCGFTPVPAARSSPEFVDGDLTELDPTTITMISKKVSEIDQDVNEYRNDLFKKGAPQQYIPALLSKHMQRQAAQTQLRETIAAWAGWQRSYGRPDSESYRRFYLMFGVDVLTAQTLQIKEALELNDKITKRMTEK